MGPSSPSDSSTNAFALSRLLPAGTLTLPLLALDDSGNYCSHTHSEDSWHPFDGSPTLLSSVKDKSVCSSLQYLLQHNFVSASCMLGGLKSRLYIRVYIIPYDLQNLQGKLRVRDESIMKLAKAHLREVLPQIVQSADDWHADDLASSGSSPTHFLPHTPDGRTLAEIYSQLPSPYTSSSSQLKNGSDSISTCLTLSGPSVKGLRSRLYQYQRETVSAMLHKELGLLNMPDPLYLPLRDMDQHVLYLQPNTMDILQQCPTVAEGRGGILCEELGTGKTVMALALILHTLDQLSQPEEALHDPRPILTPLAFRHFTSTPFVDARDRLIHPGSLVFSGQKPTCFPSLVEHLLHYVRVAADKVDLRNQGQWLEERRLWKLQELNVPFYHHYEAAPPPTQRPRRNQRDVGPRIVYLTTATLVVVPPNLLAQWYSEILKHCDSWVRVLLVRPGDELPRARNLASDYDIILMNNDSLAKEESKAKVHSLHTWAVCTCPGYSGTRVPDCTCDHFPNVSPLVQIRWKRLIVDEGHIHGTDRTRISHIAALLSVERRWLMSGTPTTDLLGLNFGSQSEAIDDDALELEYPSDTESSSPTPLADTSQPSNSSENNLVRTATTQVRIWTRSDRENLRRLGTMISNFVQVPQFAAVTQPFNAQVIQPLFNAQGPQPGAIQILTQVMASVMVRHRIEDIERDFVLPPLQQETILLDLDPFALTSYNAIQAAIAANAIDSERKDQDYLFHPSNSARLNELVENMSQMMFWHVDDNFFNVDELVKHIEEMVERAIRRQVPPEDIAMIRQSAKHVKLAVSDMSWRAIQRSPFAEMPYRIVNMPKHIFDAWTRGQREPYESGNTSSGWPSDMMFALHLLTLRELVVARPLTSEDGIVNHGRMLAEENARREALMKEQKVKRRPKSRAKKAGGGDKREADMVTETARKAEAPEKIEEMQKEMLMIQVRVNHQAGFAGDRGGKGRVDDEGEGDARSSVGSPLLSRRALMKKSPLAGVRILNSTSSKLNYILSEVLRYSGEEKFLIFSKSPLTLTHVAEGLALIRVKYLQYTSQVVLRVREQLVTTFETSDTYRVFLMELKHGSRGLNLISATRVIFCEPVWQADVEAQAIKVKGFVSCIKVKRAHRIEQMSSLCHGLSERTVKTLAIKSTAEEIMMDRKAEQKGISQKLPSLTDDFRVRQFIANPKFIDPNNATAVGSTLDFPLLPLLSAPQSSSLGIGGPSSRNVPSAINSQRNAEPGASSEQRSSKKRRIRFADEPW
ncbi:hypothetical protein EW146_g8002 [Bondarzewia mesenterica]|uniref:Helicase C-terminal domain-containing protein n=1 Tax=Bondarzewia mesenterica TaxID=1095465 RepID=A0A4V3XDZ0_9AGAM|nr:hypothetical protein EW146_g8002 [Bondarzewia mesenterica]